MATKVRQRVTLACAGDSTSRMHLDVVYAGPGNVQSVMYDGEVTKKFKDRFSLNKDGGQFALVINSTVLSDGRTYRCLDVNDGIKQRGDVEVIVFGKTYFQFVLQNSV